MSLRRWKYIGKRNALREESKNDYEDKRKEITNVDGEQEENQNTYN